MHTPNNFLTAGLILFGGIANSLDAAVIASTNFDGRTATGAVASGLNWNTNGVNDPGNMTAFQQDGPTTQNLFDNSTITQNIFAPAINVGNGNTYWTTNVSLEVLSGSTVTIEDVTFGYWAISGGAAQNVDRKSDFTIKLYDPTDALVTGATASINDVNNGTNSSSGSATPVKLTFTAPLALTETGIYRLEIKGGDYAGTDETGNHTAIDDLSINGTVAIPEPSTLFLCTLGVLGLALLRKRAS